MAKNRRTFIFSAGRGMPPQQVAEIKRYTDERVTDALTSVYTLAGSCLFSELPPLTADYLGFVHEVTEDFTTTADFVEGAGKKFPAGTNVTVVNAGTKDSPSYRYDASIGDLSAFQTRHLGTPIEVDGEDNATVEEVLNAINDYAGKAMIPVYNVATDAQLNAVFDDMDKSDKLMFVIVVTSSTVSIGASIRPYQNQPILFARKNASSYWYATVFGYHNISGILTQGYFTVRKIGSSMTIDTRLNFDIDAAFSDTSEQPVQNKIVTNALNSISSDVTKLNADETTEGSVRYVVTDALKNYYTKSDIDELLKKYLQLD